MKILIATTNQGKYKEIIHFLSDLPFEFISLGDLKKKIKPAPENEPTLEQNAIFKAKYYAQKTGYLTIADDTGLFVDALAGFPGIKAARIGDSSKERCQIILNKLKNKNRGAKFITVFAVYNPSDKNLFIANGEIKGLITNKINPNGDNDFGYNPIFYVPKMKRVFSAMTIAEKNSISQRGQALQKIKYYLQNQFGAQHIVVPCAWVIKKGRLLITLRNDPHHLEAHRKWGIPGGRVDFNQTTESTIIKEMREETGYQVKIIKQLQGITVKEHSFPNLKCQIYLVPFVCKIIGGSLKFNDAEVLDAKWIKLNDYTKYGMIKGDKEMYKNLLPELKEVIKENNL